MEPGAVHLTTSASVPYTVRVRRDRYQYRKTDATAGIDPWVVACRSRRCDSADRSLALLGKRGGLAGHHLTRGPVHHVGIWIVDNEDRVVITHGLDILWKTAPYYPPAFSAKDAQFLVSQGFTGARIGFLWVGVEPEPGSYDASYVKHIVRLNAILGRYGIRTLVDFHQDDYSASYGGDGAPAWASIGSSAEDAFENLWSDQAVDGTGLIQQFAKGWQIAASALPARPTCWGSTSSTSPTPGPAPDHAVSHLVRVSKRDSSRASTER